MSHQPVINKETIVRLIDEVLKETNARSCCSDGYCSDHHCVVHNKEGVVNIVRSGAARVTAGVGVPADGFDPAIASMIDHTLLKPDASVAEIEQLCREARQYSFASVCINPSFVRSCAQHLRDSSVNVCTVIGFPLGATTTHTKEAEARQALADGARELDMVVHVGMLKSGDYAYVESDIRAVVEVGHARDAVVKVIIETGLLTDDEKVRACILAVKAGADFVKTSTGFAKGGATVGDIALMRRVVGDALGVKASGGVRTKEQAEALIASGADRIGASASVKIVTGAMETAAAAY